MKRKLSNQFLVNFLTIFLLTILATVLAFFLLSIASKMIYGNLLKNQYSASSIIKENYQEIDATDIVNNGGGVQIVDKNYRIIYSEGLNTFDKDQFSIEEFTKFLTESKSKSYHYDILYQEQGEFWLIVTFPTSIRLDFELFYNQKAHGSDISKTRGVIIFVVSVYLFLIAFISFIYSRIVASRITKPLKRLMEGSQLLKQGNYSARINLELKNEFAEVQKIFNNMANQIENEITLRKQSEDNRRRLALDISHDLKNPMSCIQGYTEILLQKNNLSDNEYLYLEVIHNNIQRANQLLNELFELSQIDSPEFSLHLEKIDLSEALRQICGKLVPEFESKGFKYDFQIEETSIFALIDLDRFERVIQNLKSNALRYNPPGTTIKVILKTAKNLAYIDFCDDGIGIVKDLKEDIFKPFVSSNDLNKNERGSGLGLAIAYGIVKAHNGDLVLLKENDMGSTFRITLPMF